MALVINQSAGAGETHLQPKDLTVLAYQNLQC